MKLAKIYNVSMMILLVLYVITALVLKYVVDYSIFFSGWWLIVVAIPLLGKVLFQGNKITSIYFLIVTGMLFATLNKWMDGNNFLIISACLGIIALGINVIMLTLILPKKKDKESNYLPVYCAFLGSTDETLATKFKGGRVISTLGNTTLDLHDSKIETNSTIKVLSVLGESLLIVPDNVEVITSNKNILGATDNLKKNGKKSRTKLYVETTSILGSVKII